MEFMHYEGFVKNKYFRWYSSILLKSLQENRVYDSTIHERHHGLPRCLGGVETFILTFKEHYICHWLLTKFTQNKDQHKMIVAMSYFYYNKINTKAKRPLYANKSRAYENFKRVFVETQKERYSDPTLNPFYKCDVFVFRNILTNETREYTRFEAALNTPMEANEVSRLISRGYTKGLKTSSKGWDIYVPEKKIFSFDIDSVPNNTMKEKIIECENCGKKTNIGNYSRWHGKRCKIMAS